MCVLIPEQGESPDQNLILTKSSYKNIDLEFNELFKVREVQPGISIGPSPSSDNELLEIS